MNPEEWTIDIMLGVAPFGNEREGSRISPVNQAGGAPDRRGSHPEDANAGRARTAPKHGSFTLPSQPNP